MSKIFTSIVLSTEGKVDILEVKTHHVLEAAFLMDKKAVENLNNPIVLNIHVAAVICHQNGKSIGLDRVKALPIADLNAITEVILVQFKTLKI